MNTPGHYVFGDMIRRMREQRGMTQQQLADRMGKTRGAIGEHERVVNSMQERVLVQFAIAFEYPNLLAFLDDAVKMMKGDR